jgi:diguanylate cyclase (GGDEF)-like protein
MSVATHHMSKHARTSAPPRSSWALWQASVRVRVVVLVVDAAAVLLSVFALTGSTITASDLLRFGLLASMSVAYLELTRQVERRRRLFTESGATHIDVSSVWTFAGAVVLPPGLAALLAAVVMWHLWMRSWRHVDGVRLHRIIYSTAAVGLTCVIVSMTLRAWHDEITPNLVLLLAAAIVLYRVLNRLLILLAVALDSGLPSLSGICGTASANALEFSTLILGAATAVLLVQVPPLAVMVLPAVFLLQHRALLKQLVEAATIDTKTELLNAGAWRQLAQRELGRAERQRSATAVLVVDMDHFKRLNDTYGHLAGDDALKLVGEALSAELRGYDAVGRFGGEEFVALLPAVGASTAAGVAERIRARIEALRVTVELRQGGVETIQVTASIGVAVAVGGVALDDLLGAADEALYAAKGSGRNVVRQAPGLVAIAA